MQKFTPGPYRADGPDEFGDFNILHNGDALAVAAVVSNMRAPSEVHANARLISAAPELYAALKELAAAYDNYDGGSISEKRIQAAVDGAESALAKATGA
jgi:hypothetical protein